MIVVYILRVVVCIAVLGVILPVWQIPCRERSCEARWRGVALGKSPTPLKATTGPHPWNP